jgi:hypothetical protein
LGESFLPRALAILQAIRDTKAEARKIIELGYSPTGLDSGTTNLLRIEKEQVGVSENLISKLSKSA